MAKIADVVKLKSGYATFVERWKKMNLPDSIVNVIDV